MKKILIVFAVLFIFNTINSQEKLGRPFFTSGINFTLGINENYQIGSDDDNGPFIVPAALFFRVGVGLSLRKELQLLLILGTIFIGIMM